MYSISLKKKRGGLCLKERREFFFAIEFEGAILFVYLSKLAEPEDSETKVLIPF